MTTQPSTGPRPRTEAGRNFVVEVEAAAYRGGGFSVSETLGRIAAIEAEARAAALTAVEEAVREIARVADHPSIEDGPAFARGARSVLAVLAKFQEDALHPVDKEAETSHE